MRGASRDMCALQSAAFERHSFMSRAAGKGCAAAWRAPAQGPAGLWQRSTMESTALLLELDVTGLDGMLVSCRSWCRFTAAARKSGHRSMTVW